MSSYVWHSGASFYLMERRAWQFATTRVGGSKWRVRRGFQRGELTAGVHQNANSFARTRVPPFSLLAVPVVWVQNDLTLITTDRVFSAWKNVVLRFHRRKRPESWAGIVELRRKKSGLVRELNPGPLAPEARIIPLDQRAIGDGAGDSRGTRPSCMRGLSPNISYTGFVVPLSYSLSLQFPELLLNLFACKRVQFKSLYTVLHFRGCSCL